MQTKLKQHLAIATGAASAAALPMGADAAIVYKDNTNAFSVSYGGPTSADWDIDGVGGTEFSFRTNVSRYINIRSDSTQNGRGLAATVGATSVSFENLAPGFALSPNLAASYIWNRYSDRNRTLMASSAPGGTYGLQNATLGSNYIGFRFLSGTDMLYGWAELILSTTGGGTVTVNRWAYNDTPDGGIEVGQTQDTPVPAPTTLALLAAGAFGIRRWRARRAAA